MLECILTRERRIKALIESTHICTAAFGKVLCQTFFLPCNGDQIQVPCLSTCLATLDPCNCGEERGSNAEEVCTSVFEDVYPIDPYLPFIDAAPCNAATTGFPTVITTVSVTSSPVTSSPVTSSPITSSRVTSSQVTSSQVTSSPLTSSRVTSSTITTNKSLTSGVLPATTGRPSSTTSQSAGAFCSQFTIPGTQGYYCSTDMSGFYQCLNPPFSGQDAFQHCPAGTHCSCGFGIECSSMGSPCK